ncbi:MAG TPA: nickel-dependent lactate racemase [Spirochaetia bacterium]|nr:nickel-dependent lactate racemase [Spirochaetia bacterium]HRZ63704.1 nickel-dependent lactate racemase [Spirochaetia bacterium]
MRVEVPYLKDLIPIDLPEGSLVVEPNDVEAAADPVSLVRGAVDAPIESRPLGSFLEGAGRTLVIVNDATRPTPTRAVLDAIGDELEAAGASFIVATGAHRAPTEEEYRQILGPHYGRFRPRTVAHDARDAASQVDLGKTRNGTPILLDKAVFEADRVLVTGSVEPHYFAGYTGGRKAFLPGVAGYATIEANHKLALSPKAVSLELDDNPVSQDMEDALRLIPKPVFSIMTVLDKRQRLVGCCAGEIRSSFKAAVERADAIFAVRMRERADIVISVARFPMDIDLYQSQKAIDNGALALADGGILIMVASCRDGVGDTAFLELLGSAANPAEALRRIGEGYRLGYHKAAKIAVVASRASIRAVSELDAATLRKAFISKQRSIPEALRDALSEKGPSAKVAVLLDGTVTVPLLG